MYIFFFNWKVIFLTFVNNISLFVYIDFSDKNHVKKNIVKRLNELRSKYKELSIKVVNAISKNFSYMVSQNKGNVSGIDNGLKALVGHLFGDHECCSSSWCGYQRDKAYQHSNLPYGKDLTSQYLKKDLEKLFLGNLMNQAKKLANLSSSQANESLNYTIASKAPKAKHYWLEQLFSKKMRDIPMSPRYRYVQCMYNHVFCENCFQILYLHSVYTMN